MGHASDRLDRVAVKDQPNRVELTGDEPLSLSWSELGRASENLALQLQSARLALLRGEQVVFEQTLDDTSALLSQYFDSESAQVASAQATLAEIRSNVFATSAPDISGSLRLLRQFRTLQENSQ